MLERAERLLTTRAVVLEGTGSLLATGAAVVEGTKKLLTKAAALLDGPGRQQGKQYCRTIEAVIKREEQQYCKGK